MTTSLEARQKLGILSLWISCTRQKGNWTELTSGVAGTSLWVPGGKLVYYCLLLRSVYRGTISPLSHLDLESEEVKRIIKEINISLNFFCIDTI